MELTRLQLFSGIAPAEGERILKCLKAREASYKSRDVILSFDGNQRTIGVLCEGKAALHRVDREGNESLIELIAENGLFGEALAFSEGIAEDIMAVALTDCSVLFIDYEHITKRCENACLSHSTLVENLFRMIANKSLTLGERIEVLTQRTIREKLVRFFELYAIREKSNRFTLPFTVQGLAEYICADRSATSRELSRMRREGLVELSRREVVYRGS